MNHHDHTMSYHHRQISTWLSTRVSCPKTMRRTTLLKVIERFRQKVNKKIFNDFRKSKRVGPSIVLLIVGRKSRTLEFTCWQGSRGSRFMTRWESRLCLLSTSICRWEITFQGFFCQLVQQLGQCGYLLIQWPQVRLDPFLDLIVQSCGISLVCSSVRSGPRDTGVSAVFSAVTDILGCEISLYIFPFLSIHRSRERLIKLVRRLK